MADLPEQARAVIIGGGAVRERFEILLPRQTMGS